MLRSSLVSFLGLLRKSRWSRAKFRPEMRRQNQRYGNTESLEVRQLLTGDFVFAKAILNSAQPELSASTNDLAVDSAGGTLIASEFSIFDTENTEFKDTRAVVTKVNSSGTVLWERTLGSNSLHVDARSIAVDGQQNVYVVGSFRGIVDFNPSSGTTALDGGKESSYLWKLSSTGNLLWVRQLAGSNSQLVVSPAGNVYVTGTFQGTYDFDNGTAVVELTSATPGSYIVKYSSTGSLTWARQFSSTGSISTGQASDAIEIDQNENVYVSGLFTGTADLNPGAGVFTATSSGINKSFLAKLTSAGDLTWAIVQTAKMLPKGLAVDGTGSVFLAGNFSGAADANPGRGYWPLISSGVSDIYLTKLDSAGGFVWSRRFGGTGDELIGGVAVDGQGNPHLTGAWSGTVDFDPGPGIVNKTSSGQYDPFVLKVTSTAEFGWVRAFNGASTANGIGIVVDSSGAITTIGEFSGLTDFDPGLAVHLLDSEQAVYVSRLSPDFVYQTTESGADDLVLRKNGNNLELFHKGLKKIVESHPLSQIRSVLITGQTQQTDTLTIDMAFGGAFGIDGGIKFDGGSGVNDKIQIIGVSGQTAVYRPSDTGIGNDTVTVNSADFLLGVAGGAFKFQAGSGTDTVIANGNTSWTLTDTSLTAGSGGVLQLDSIETATLSGGVSNNILNASLFKGNVTLNGLGGNDKLFAALRSSVLNGGDGDDQLHGGLESDVLNGGRGADQFILKGTDSADTLVLRKTSTGNLFLRRNRATGALLETDTITSEGTMLFTILALGGDDLIAIDSLFTQGGTVDGGLGTDTCTAPRSWKKISC